MSQTNYYYRLNPATNEISMSAPTKAALIFNEGDEKNVLHAPAGITRGYDGKLYIAGTEPQMPPEMAEKQAMAPYKKAIDKYMNDFARTRDYDSMASAASYEGDIDPQFALEGDYCKGMRSQVYRAAWSIFGAVKTGLRPMPTVQELLDELPVLTWPDEVEE